MSDNKFTAHTWLERIAASLIYLMFGLVIMMVFKPWGSLPLSGTKDAFYRYALIIFLLAAWLIARRFQRLAQFASLLFALLIFMITLTIDLFSGKLLFTIRGFNDSTPSGIALMKLAEGVLISSILILLTWASGEPLGSIYLQKGRLGKGLLIGGIAFVAAAALSVPMADLFGIRDVTPQKVLAWLPWILIAIISNAFMEELLFRGLFLRKLEPFTGKWIANILVAIVFIAPHLTVNYAESIPVFGLVLIPLALGWGWIMQSTDSIWGSFLFHAGMDIPIFLGIFSQM